MRFCLLLACLSGALSAAEPAPTAEPWPLWDGHETPAEYGQRVGLPPTKTLDLGNGVTLECVLIPAGTFIMGTREPVPVDEESFRKRVVTGQALVAASAGVLLVLLTVVVLRAIRRKSWPQVSLGRLLALTAVTAFGIWGGLHWRQAAQDWRLGMAAFDLEQTRFANSYKDEMPAHRVTLTKPFYMGKYEVTITQYQQITKIPGLVGGPNNPSDSVSWQGAKEFCQMASQASGEVVRLPTEAEWEYSCRAGTRTLYPTGDQTADLERASWYKSNSHGTTHSVGEKEPNSFGLYDMLGNVWESCGDWYEEGYYTRSPEVDPLGPQSGEYIVLRGGSYHDKLKWCRPANRYPIEPSAIFIGLVGFRVVVEVPPRAP